MGNNFEQRSASPDTFFAALGAKLADPDPEVAAFFSFVSFFSRGGTVSIDYIDSERIAGTFRVTVRALAPLDGWVNDRFEWREATVTGNFAGPFAPDPSRGVRINRPSQEIYRCGPGA